MESSDAPRLIITGFGPFAGVERNPTTWIVGNLEKQNTGDRQFMHVLV